MTAAATPRVKTAWLWAALVVATSHFTAPGASWLAGPTGVAAGTVGLALVVVGVFWRLWATLHIGGQKDKSLVAGGPYAMSRHPLYFGSTCILCGLALRSGRPALLVLALAYVVIVLAPSMRREDKALAAAFPADHAGWSKGLSPLLPTRRPGPAPSGPISLFALRREGLAALVALAVLLTVDIWTGRAGLWAP